MILIYHNSNPRQLSRPSSQRRGAGSRSTRGSIRHDPRITCFISGFTPSNNVFINVSYVKLKLHHIASHVLSTRMTFSILFSINVNVTFQIRLHDNLPLQFCNSPNAGPPSPHSLTSAKHHLIFINYITQHIFLINAITTPQHRSLI